MTDNEDSWFELIADIQHYVGNEKFVRVYKIFTGNDFNEKSPIIAINFTEKLIRLLEYHMPNSGIVNNFRERWDKIKQNLRVYG